MERKETNKKNNLRDFSLSISFLLNSMSWNFKCELGQTNYAVFNKVTQVIWWRNLEDWEEKF